MPRAQNSANSGQGTLTPQASTSANTPGTFHQTSSQQQRYSQPGLVEAAPSGRYSPFEVEEVVEEPEYVRR